MYSKTVINKFSAFITYLEKGNKRKEERGIKVKKVIYLRKRKGRKGEDKN